MLVVMLVLFPFVVLVAVPLLLPIVLSSVQLMLSLSVSVTVQLSVLLLMGTPVLWLVGISKLSVGLLLVVLNVYIALVYW